MAESLAVGERAKPELSVVEVGGVMRAGLMLVDELERLRGFVVAATRRGFGQRDGLDGGPEDELDLAYWTSISRGM